MMTDSRRVGFSTRDSITLGGDFYQAAGDRVACSSGDHDMDAMGLRELPELVTGSGGSGSSTRVFACPRRCPAGCCLACGVALVRVGQLTSARAPRLRQGSAGSPGTASEPCHQHIVSLFGDRVCLPSAQSAVSAHTARNRAAAMADPDGSAMGPLNSESF